MGKKPVTNEDLARMIKKGFDHNDKRFDDIDKRLSAVDKRFDKVETRLSNLEQGHEDIQMRLGNVAFKFEVDDLKKRVKKIEFKLGIRNA